MEWILMGVNVLFAVIGWLLVSRDAQRGKEIADIKSNSKVDFERLYHLHHANEEKIAEHKLVIAQNHYTQPQVDFKFQQLNSAIKELSVDIKELTKVLTDHLVRDVK